jgi:hypothetical protein
MKEIKSKKTGLTHILSEEQYAGMVREGNIIKRFDVTEIKGRTIIPVSKEVPKEIIKSKKNEG